MRRLLKRLNLLLQVLHLDFDERGELCVKLVHALAIKTVFLVPFLYLVVAHYFCLSDGRVVLVTFSLCFGFVAWGHARDR